MTLTDSLLSAPFDSADERPDLAAPRVVVAVDSRPSSADALAWAADEALCRGMRMRIVTAFADPESPHVPKTIGRAMQCQQRLRQELAKSRPWLDEAEFVVHRGSLRTLLAEAAEPGDVLVVGEAPDVSTMDASRRPRCPVVIVPRAFADT